MIDDENSFNLNFSSKVCNNYDFLKCFKEVTSAQQGCIYLIKDTVNINKYYCYLKQLFSMWICVKL